MENQFQVKSARKANKELKIIFVALLVNPIAMIEVFKLSSLPKLSTTLNLS